MTPNFQPFSEAHGDTALQCPGCGQPSLQQKKVALTQLTADQNARVEISLTPFAAEHWLVAAGHSGPSNEARHTMQMLFSCTNCDASPVLTVSHQDGRVVYRFTPNQEPALPV